MCDWRKLPRRVTSRPEIEISGKRLAFSNQTSSIEPSYKTGPKQVKMSISPIAQGFLKIFRVQNVALTVRRPKHPSLVWCITIFLYETFSRLVPRLSNWGHHIIVQKWFWIRRGARAVPPRNAEGFNMIKCYWVNFYNSNYFFIEIVDYYSRTP
jgi:hypothetical protein